MEDSPDIKTEFYIDVEQLLRYNAPMNMILLFQEDFISEQRVVLKDRRHEHIVKILKAGLGDSLCVGVFSDKVGEGTIVQQTNEQTILDIALSKAPVKKTDISLILCLCRPPVLKRVIYTATILGVKEIYIINSQKVEKSFWGSKVLKQEELEKQIFLGLEQTRDTICPDVFTKRSFKEFVKNDIPTIIKNKRAILFDPNSQDPCPHNIEEEAVVVIGPEGGFDDYEIESFKKSGFEDYHLGHRTQRVESVLPYVIGRLCP